MDNGRDREDIALVSAGFCAIQVTDVVPVEDVEVQNCKY